MARRRMIDPNIWASEDMAKLTLRQRLMVIGMFSNSDDHGKGIAKPAYIRSTIFPYDDIPINEIIDDLETLRSIISIHFYEVEGNSYYRFINWLKWQTVQKPQVSLIPDQVENHSGMSQESFSSKGKEEKGKEVGKEEKGKGEKPTHNFLELINKLNLKCKGIWEVEQVESYLTTMDVDLIDEALKRSEHKKSVAYALGILTDWNEHGHKHLSDIKPKVGENNEKIEGQLRHEQSAPEDKPITGGKTGALPSKWANILPLHNVSG